MGHFRFTRDFKVADTTVTVTRSGRKYENKKIHVYGKVNRIKDHGNMLYEHLAYILGIHDTDMQHVTVTTIHGDTKFISAYLIDFDGIKSVYWHET